MEQEATLSRFSENPLSEMPNKIGRWTIVEKIKGKDCGIYYRCICECGTEKIICKSNLTSGRTKSCGCLRRELSSVNLRKSNEYLISEKDGIVVGKATNTGNEFFIDYEDYSKIKNISWYETNNVYIAHRERGGKVILLHRIVVNAPDGMVVDHINHNKLDNRKNNLRICTQRENVRNPSVLPKGISEIRRGNDRKYYIVHLGGKYRGCFKDYEKAKALRDEIIKNEYFVIKEVKL